MASLYFYKARSLFLIRSNEIPKAYFSFDDKRRRIPLCRYVDYINVPYNSSLEKKMGKLVCYLLKCKKKIEVQKYRGIVGKLAFSFLGYGQAGSLVSLVFHNG